MGMVAALTKQEQRELEILRARLRTMLKALDEIREPASLRLITSGKRAIAGGAAGLPLSSLWDKLRLR
jgi:hypothetical protein